MSILEIVIPTVLFIALVILRAEGIPYRCLMKDAPVVLPPTTISLQEANSLIQCTEMSQHTRRMPILFISVKPWPQQQETDRKFYDNI